ncbi:MAG: redoxin domain-containing protein [Mucilaginibacter polytrichastri]|nr:redoxin domain-containing protein [Mucilaginibacter polytrichastri]
MKPYHFIFLFPLITSCRSTFVIEGTAPHLESGYAYIENPLLQGKADSFRIVDHRFYYKGKIKEPTNYSLSIVGHEPGRDHGYAANRNMWLQRGSHVQVELGAVVAPKVIITDSDVEAEDMNYRKAGPKPRAYIAANPDSYLAAQDLYYELVGGQDPDTASIADFYDQFTKRIQKSQYGKAIKRYLNREYSLQIGQKFPDFVQPDTSGNPVRLSSIKSRYVLVDFWASWCTPCRGDNPNIVRAYERFHEKGFEIISISSDGDKAKWIEAIHDDNLNWMHVSDLKKFDGFAIREYHIRAIPDNFLLDKEGKIIARGLRGGELEKKLEALL